MKRDTSRARSAAKPRARRLADASVDAAVARLAELLLSSDSIAEIGAQVLEQARGLTASAAGYVGYLDTQTGEIVCPEGCVQGFEGGSHGLEGLWHVQRQVLAGGAPLLLEGLPRLGRLLGVPARLGDAVVGQLGLAQSTREYGEGDVAAAIRLASLYALALRRCRLDSQALRRRQKVFQTLTDFDEVTSRLSSQGVARGALQLIKERTRIDRLSMALLERGELSLVELEELTPAGFAPGTALPVEGSPAGEVIRKTQPEYRTDILAGAEAGPVETALLAAGIRAWYMVPLVVAGVCTGTLNASSTSVAGISEDDRELLSLLAPRLALAIQNSRLHEDLQASERRHRALFHSVPVSIWEEDVSELEASLARLRAQGVTDFRAYFRQHPGFVRDVVHRIRVLQVNDYTLTLYGARDGEELLGGLDRVFTAETYSVFADEIAALASGAHRWEGEAVSRTLAGKRLDVMVRVEFPAATSPRRIATVSITDITKRVRAEKALRCAHDELERRVRERTADQEQAKHALEADIAARKRAEQERDRLERELRQIRVLEAVGLLAGGVAHDFNNILGSIIGCLFVAKLKAGGDAGLTEELEQAQALCKRGGELTRQLLTVARRRTGRVEIVGVPALLEEVEGLLRRTLPKNIALHVDAGSDLPRIRGDRSLLSTAFLHLGINARDAMPRGGTLSIRAWREDKGDEGEWAVIEVGDTGTGVSEVLQERIFDPFFTTKPLGEGTGLGLSMVLATIQECRGSISLASQCGKGSTFVVRLPAALGADGRGRCLPAGRHPLISAHVVVVEDEDQVARMIVQALERSGYATFRASTGLEALEILHEHRDSVGLVVLDLMLPELGGEEVYRLLQGLVPEVPVLLTTGREDLAQALAPDAPILSKPFTSDELLDAVAKVLSDLLVQEDP